MSKLIRIKDETFEELSKLGRWSDTMDVIISRLLKQRKTSSVSTSTPQRREVDC
jgi:hypothetical protein